ncbi:hypothetical protein HZC21_05500 [Candidatus Peregrinibacteria bacterium]|nr:hypothetical protein [Candidatus Peregrinibacteria bacterium]
MKFFLKALPFIGIFLFGGVVFVTILFAEGYQYDFQKKDIVKKGIVYFKGELKNAQVLLDGENLPYKNSFSGELRVLPGPHDIEIRKKGYFVWKKHIIVPEDKVFEFAQIRLLPDLPAGRQGNKSQFIKTITPLESLILQAWSQNGIFVSNPKLHFAKYYFLNSNGKFWIKDLPFKFDFSKLTPISEKIIVGINKLGRIFYYNFEERKEVFVKDVSAVDLKASGGKLFALDKYGKVFDLSEDNFNPQLFFNIEQTAQNFIRVQSDTDHFAFLISSKSKNIFVVTKRDGSIVFQSEGVISAYIEKDAVYYTKGKELFVFDLDENRARDTFKLDSEIDWFSRVGDSFHFLFLTKKLDLLYCDEDFGNCQVFAKLDFPFIEAAENRLVFITAISGNFTLLDFGEESFFPQFLEDLISAAGRAVARLSN